MQKGVPTYGESGREGEWELGNAKSGAFPEETNKILGSDWIALHRWEVDQVDFKYRVSTGPRGPSDEVTRLGFTSAVSAGPSDPGTGNSTHEIPYRGYITLRTEKST